jgi:hypothetical protein
MPGPDAAAGLGDVGAPSQRSARTSLLSLTHTAFLRQVQFHLFCERELRVHNQRPSNEKRSAMHKYVTILTGVGLLLGTAHHAFPDEEAPRSEKESGPELPEVSVIADIQALTTDAEDDPNDEKLRVKEIELGFQGYLNPSVRGDLIIAFEHQYVADDSVDTELEVEEAYVSFLDLPGGLEAQVGRKLLGFGRLNPVHPHHWAFADTPLALNNLFGSHPWWDDGAELSYRVPNPADIHFKLAAGVWNGRRLGHVHTLSANDSGASGDHGAEELHDHGVDSHDEEDHHAEDHEEHAESDSDGGHNEVIDWDGRVFTGRASADLPMTEQLSAQAGYSVAGDESNNLLHGADLVLKYQWPQTYRRVRWHTEWFHYDRDEDGSDSSGLFSLLQVARDEHWELGGRYDWTELLEDREQDTWAGSGFLTYYLTHSTYVRGQYQYREHADGEDENIFTAQFVWGIGRHRSASAPYSDCSSPGCSSCSDHR